MKSLILASLASAVFLCGCASTESNPNAKVAKSEESYIPLGTLIARKTPSRADNTSILSKQALENDRIMGSAARNDGR